MSEDARPKDAQIGQFGQVSQTPMPSEPPVVSEARGAEAPVVVSETLDCIGLYCPQPLLQTREVMDRLAPGEVLEVLATDPAAEEDLKRFAKRAGHEFLLVEDKGDHKRFLIRRGT